MCEFCMRHAGNGQECGKDYTIHPCANGDLGVRAEYIDGGIVLFKDHNMASGYFDINYCPICGRRIGKETDSEPVPIQKVLEDMYDPMITWKDDSLWYLTRPMTDDDIAETHTFQQSSEFGVFEGTITVVESKTS